MKLGNYLEPRRLLSTIAENSLSDMYFPVLAESDIKMDGALDSLLKGEPTLLKLISGDSEIDEAYNAFRLGAIGLMFEGSENTVPIEVLSNRIAVLALRFSALVALKAVMNDRPPVDALWD